MTAFALHSNAPAEPVIGRFVARGLHDEHNGTACAVIEGIDGRTHHLRFSSLDVTGDAKRGAIVETRLYDDDKGRKRLSLAVRSDLTIEAQIKARGATWLDRQLLAHDPVIANAGFGEEVQAAMKARTDRLIADGMARRQGQHIEFTRDLLANLRQREIKNAEPNP